MHISKLIKLLDVFSSATPETFSSSYPIVALTALTEAPGIPFHSISHETNHCIL